MSDNTSDTPDPNPPKPAKLSQVEAERQARAERVAQALRDNLRKRKLQARARAEPSDPPES